MSLIMVFGSFVDTILYTTAAVYAFYLGTSLAVIVLHIKELHVERSYRVPVYPVTTLMFCVVCALLIYSCVSYALATRRASPVVLISVLVAGMIVYRLTDIRGSARQRQS